MPLFMLEILQMDKELILCMMSLQVGNYTLDGLNRTQR